MIRHLEIKFVSVIINRVPSCRAKVVRLVSRCRPLHLPVLLLPAAYGRLRGGGGPAGRQGVLRLLGQARHCHALYTRHLTEKALILSM